MIPESEMIAEMLKECPEIKPRWDEHGCWMAEIKKPRTAETDALILALFLDTSYKDRQTHFFQRFFAFLERMIAGGDPGTQSRIDQILKQLRMSLVTRMNGLTLYAAWMGPKTKERWEQVDREIVATNPKRAGKPRRKIDSQTLREYKVSLTRCKPGEVSVPSDYRELTGAGTATKLGGNPNWLQPDGHPNCCCCNQPMTFVAQIDSVEHINVRPPEKMDFEKLTALRKDQQWMFGDVGMIYVFFCFDCHETKSVFQEH